MTNVTKYDARVAAEKADERKAVDAANARIAKTIPVTVLYNDAIVDRTIEGGPAIEGYRASTTSTKEMNEAGNMSWAFSRIGYDSYQDGDPLLKVYEADVENIYAGVDPVKVAKMIAEDMFEKLNIGQPEGWAFRSMSVGDVVIVGESAFFVDSIGFKATTINNSEIKETA